jgi:heterodisulfide reductase subunit A-like polyferredoxin
VVVLVADTLEAAEAEASMVVVVVSMEEVSAVAVSTAVAFVVAVLVAILVQWEADTRSPAAELVRGVAATGVAIGVITVADSLMMSSSPATSAFRSGGAIRTDITVTTITRTDITVMTITRTITMGTAGTVTTVAPVTDTAMAADPGICRVCGVGDKRGYPKRIPHSTLAGETGNIGGGRPPRRSLPVR